MFKPGDLVQPRMGGPKLKVVEVNDDQIVAVQASKIGRASCRERV